MRFRDDEFTAAAVRAAADAEADSQRAANAARFFQAHPGGYGEGEEFIGLTVPVQRTIAKRFRGIGPEAVADLFTSSVHEHRLIAIFLLRYEFDHAGTDAERAEWIDLYLTALRSGRIDNWDLVDSSADPIFGVFLYGRGDHTPLLDFATAEDLWLRRVGIIGTFPFIRHGDPTPLLEIADIVVTDRRDLIQKAFGWMLREAGKRVDRAVLTDYLDQHAAQMGRTALRYAIEHLDPDQRAHYRSLR
ncbi:DNA alkylation repair protein [Gordonia sp. ABSL1-1]|uniref:DNA alkylation repair protein n=1 Tax=Gordonia sp. ABSL1-1 TaxID=3053923 RepID=UPI00257452A6|nr:DNA alkylation repair protein [Gordonia sp. ABSL1-1]MDL9937891.1 DNA alkylation repair protein [Gordonia sp. ABSL1-1]